MENTLHDRRAVRTKLPERGGRAETHVFRALFDDIRRDVPYTEAMVITSFPRGSLQIAQPPTLNEGLLKAYSKDFHLEDRLSWQVMVKNQVLRLSDAWKGETLDSVRFYSAFLQPLGLRYGIAAPLAGPVLDGYPGALHLYRNKELGAFSEAELRTLGGLARDLDENIRLARAARHSPPCNIVLRHDTQTRQFVFNGHVQLQLWPNSLHDLDSRLREGMLADAKQRLSHVNGKEIVSDRVPLADSRGDLWNFRVVVHRRYPALGDGPFIFYCQQPECMQWGALRASDFQADSEIARLIPAMKFMQEHFGDGPTLVGISKTVDLSPFHFHRRFTELLGITPKHFLLDCQIEEAKRMLVAGGKSLPDVAKVCGFAHQSHFTSRFKQATGLTPTRWRRLAKESQQSSAN